MHMTGTFLISEISKFPVQLVVITSVVTIIFALVLTKCKKGKRGNYPPGPKGLPLLGYLPYLGQNEHLALDKLRKSYGDIFSLRLGSRDVVVLSDFNSIKEAFNKDEISARPTGMLKFTDKEGLDHLGVLEGKPWKELRKFTHSTLRTLGMGKSKAEEIITGEIQILLEKLQKHTWKGQFSVTEYLYPAIDRIILSMICGRSISEDEEFSRIVDSYSGDLLRWVNARTPAFYLPFLRPFLSLFYPKTKKYEITIDTMERFLWKEISDHEKDHDKGAAEDYMGYFITEMKKEVSEKVPFTKGILNGQSQSLLVGNDATKCTLEFALLSLALHHWVQEKAYQEIIRVVGKERQLCWNDRDDLPYLDALTAEVSRFFTIVPLSVAHMATEDTRVAGYDIPKDTIVIGNLYSVHMSPKLWRKPQEFLPERFLTPDGKRTKDPEFLFPFSIGKRLCPGDKLARMEIFLILGSILQKFKILPPDSGITFDGKLDIILHPNNSAIKLENREKTL